jgi:glycosyltransferase involved in cell wall biosynthesis
MRIALLVPGGVDRSARVRVIPVLLAFIERLARRHHVVVIAFNQEPEPCEYSLLGAHVMNLGLTSTRNPAIRMANWLKKVLSALRSTDGKFDVLHAFWAHPTGSIGIAAGACCRIPVVVSIGGGELIWLPQISYGGQGSWQSRKATSTAIRFANFVSAGSTYALRPLEKIRPDALWLPLGVETRFFHGPIERSAGPPWRLLHVASLNQVKDQTTLLQAMRLVLESHSQTHLDCIGGDTLGGRMQALAKDLKIGAAVQFHGFRPLDEIVPFYHKAHLCLQASLHESMGAAVLEAATAGVPTVGTNVGIVEEMAPRAALAVPRRDPLALAEAIVRLLDDSDRRECLARNAQDFAQTYNADWTCAQFEAIYNRVSRR